MRRGASTAVLTALAATPASAAAAPSQLQVNGAVSPLGIGSAPRFSWQSNVQRQSAYELAVSRGATTVWDSGKVTSSDDLDIPYGGPAPESATSYDWQVRVWDGSGQASGWSAPARFETGLLDRSDWGAAKWIGGRQPQDHDWTDMTETVDFRATDGASGITALFHAQPVGKTWGEAYAWQLRSAAGSAALFAAASAGDTNVKVSDTTDFNVGDKLRIDSGAAQETATITAVGSPALSTRLTAAAAAGDTTVTVASGAGLVAGDTLVIDSGEAQESATVQSVTTVFRTTTVTLANGLARAHASGASAVSSGGGISFTPALSATHAAGAAVSTPVTMQLAETTRHYAGNTGIPGSSGATAVDWGVNYFDPQSETNPTAVGSRTVKIATLSGASLGGVTPERFVGADHQLKIDVSGDTITTSLDGQQIDRRTLSGDQVRTDGTIGFGAGTALVRDVTVTAPDGKGFNTDFAGGANPFEAGIVTPDGLGLTPKDPMLPIANAEPALRRDFTVGPSRITSARLYVAAGGWPVVTVDGRRVTDDGQLPAADGANVPLRNPDQSNYDKTVLYSTYDVTRFLDAGAHNVLGAVVGRAWYGTQTPDEWFWNMTDYHGAPRLLARLVVTHADGSTETVVSDDGWKTADSPTTYSSVYTGEKYDARRADALGSWQSPGYGDAGWAPATIMNPPGSCTSPHPAPCHGFIPDTPPAPVGFTPAALRADESEPVVVTQVLHPLAITETYPGSHVYIFDMGQISSGWAHLHLTGVPADKAGTTIRMRMDELVSGAGTAASPLTLTENNGFVIGSFQTDYYTLGHASTQDWSPSFRYGGQRYVEVRGLYDLFGRAPNLAQDANLITLEVARSGFATTGTFTSNNALLGRIQQNAGWAERNNAFEKMTDTPTREKNGWTGDAWADAEAVMQGFDANRFYTQWLRDFPDSQASTGHLPVIVPAAKGGYGYDQTPGWNNVFTTVPGWDAAFIDIPWELYEYYGNTQILSDVYAGQKKFMDYYARFFTPANNYDYSNSSLGEYASAGGTGNNNVINHQLYYFFADTMAREAALLGHADDAASYRALANDVLKTFISDYWDESTHSFQKPPLGNLESENIMALAYDMVPGSDLSPTDPRYLAGTQTQKQNRASAMAVVANDIQNTRGTHLGTGVFGARYLFNLLDEYGYKNLAYSVATQTTSPSWGWQIGQGATSLWENWTGGSNDHHYWSVINTWFYQGLGGIQPTAPGYRTVTVKPFVPSNAGTSSVPPDLSGSATLNHVMVSQKTARGEIADEWWRRDDGRIAMIVKVPANTPTEVWVPTMGKTVDALPSATFVRNDTAGGDPYAVYSVPGGATYLFNLSASQRGGVGGTVPATLSLSLGAAASFGAFTPGVDRTYDASTTANVTSTAGDAALSVSDPSANATGRLVNGSFALDDALQVDASSAAGTGGAFAPLSTAGSPLTILSYAGPVSNDAVTIGFHQHVGSSQALRTGGYGKTLTFTLSTTNP